MFSNLNTNSTNALTEQQKKIIQNTTDKAETFVKDYYYHLYDTNRKEVVKLYKDISISIWNGTECKGITNIEKLLSEIPTSNHSVECYDCQPVTSDDPENPNILIVTSGKVTYNVQSSHSFHHTFLLIKDPTTQNLCISYDCLRLTS
ncbi:hypothetical protein DLAC_08791 [Tieghemostelium lacteum]|uniref:NTF2-related export protein n=1 Tax=Tieghemostelium lacteum TaxID=361077 RepID=A0A151Z897_TIELA|nr:hypothetical protein DLAC_08791 [Tieghemostelium lacteum]|eukprot:KYQ90193.1 hypothetical protein DLAC_08791 [Tieghemostelium lacteum]